MKPNIVFFGENLGETFHNKVGEDHSKVDLLVVIGSSLKVCFYLVIIKKILVLLYFFVGSTCCTNSF